MKSIQFALREISHHMIRTMLTVFLFAFALGMVTYSVSAMIPKAAEYYLEILKENDTKALCFEAIDKSSTCQQVKNLLPEGQKIYPISFRTGGTSVEGTVLNVQKEDLPNLGYTMVEGYLPREEGEIALSMMLYEEMKMEGIRILFTDLSYIDVAFTTFREAQAILKQKVFGTKTAMTTWNFVGVVDTGYDFAKVDEWTKALNANQQSDLMHKIATYKMSSAHCCTFEVKPNATLERLCLTAMPQNYKDQRALLAELQFDISDSTLSLKRHSPDYKIIENHYVDDFELIIRAGKGMQTLLIPLSVIFAVIALVMMITLEGMCAKSSREEVATLRSLGMSNKKVYAISFVRSMFLSAVSFLVSIAFAFFWQYFFSKAGVLNAILENFGVERDMMGSFQYITFPPFIFTFLFSLAVGFLASLSGYRRYRKIMPAEIYRLNRE